MLPILALAFLAVPQTPLFDDARQIHWERTLDDALYTARMEKKPLLIAINADGESASERIVRERYRDPAWVAATRSFVCVIGSVFRHNTRDYDDAGRRIPCPRLGEITCGEHIAMEPAVHGRYLAGEHIEIDGQVTDRISPRHALLQLDGTKTWDLYLLFDLRDLDAKLFEAAKSSPAAEPPLRAPPDDRRHRARLALEDAIALDPAPFVAHLLQPEGERLPFVDSGIVDETRRVLPSLEPLDDRMRSALFDSAAASGKTGELAWAVRDRLNAPSGETIETSLLPLYADLAGNAPVHRTLLVSLAVLADARTAETAQRALRTKLNSPDAPYDVRAALRAGPRAQPKRGDRPKDVLPEPQELEAALAAAEDELSRERGNPALQAKLGRAALLLARRRLQDNTPGVDLLLEDARNSLATASKANPSDLSLLLDRARIANLQSKFEDQEALALEALKTRGSDPWNLPLDDATTEAFRWLGDASARALGARSGSDLATQARGMLFGARSLTAAATGAEADGGDWVSLASFYGALGRKREHVDLVFEGLKRFPANTDLRTELASACWGLGQPELLVAKSEELAEHLPDWAECAWYAGYALVLEAESLRRREDADGAIESYTRAGEHFRRAIELEPSFRDSSEHYLGMCALGRGFAHLLADRRDAAAQSVVEAASTRPQAMAQRDGLDREGVDLIDGVLEWRASGPSPVDALAWLDQLDRADPRNAFWSRVISDAELREGLRAFGRGASEEGDAYLQRALEAARNAVKLEASDANRRTLAQSANVFAERRLEQGGDPAQVRELLGEAAPLVGLEAPAASASTEDLRTLAAAIRSKLGAARPAFRPGR